MYQTGALIGAQTDIGIDPVQHRFLCRRDTVCVRSDLHKYSNYFFFFFCSHFLSASIASIAYLPRLFLSPDVPHACSPSPAHWLVPILQNKIFVWRTESKYTDNPSSNTCRKPASSERPAKKHSSTRSIKYEKRHHIGHWTSSEYAHVCMCVCILSVNRYRISASTRSKYGQKKNTHTHNTDVAH